MREMELPVVGSTVRLRQLTPADGELLDAWSADPANRGEFNDFGIPPSPRDRETLGQDPLEDERRGELLIERIQGGFPIGLVSWHRVAYGPNDESAAWNIGISLVPDARGHGHGTEAQRLVADYLLSATGVYRVEASTDVENLAEQRSLEKAGFQREGVLRAAQSRHGVRHDLVSYARLRSDR